MALRRSATTAYNEANSASMTSSTLSWSVPVPCDASVHWLEERLVHAGLRLLRTFDLHAARDGAAGCTCPHHGTAACDCQMVVVLVYAPTGAPVSLVIHGNDGQSWLSLIDRPDQRADPSTMLAIQMALRTDSIPEGPTTPHVHTRHPDP